MQNDKFAFLRKVVEDMQDTIKIDKRTNHVLAIKEEVEIPQSTLESGLGKRKRGIEEVQTKLKRRCAESSEEDYVY